MTGRIITCKRHHIKPTSITAEEYMQYQAENRQTGPPDDILEHIKNNLSHTPAQMFTTIVMTAKAYIVNAEQIQFTRQQTGTYRKNIK